MKIRNGFVSNSSSSNFIVIGNRVAYYNVDPADVKAGNIYIEGENLYSDAIDFFQATQKMINLIKKEANLHNVEIYKIHKIISEDEEFKIVKNDLPDDPVSIRVIEKTNHYTKDFKDFKKRYGVNNED